MENKYCPFCGKKTLGFIENCESDSDVVKTSWACQCRNFVLYIYEFIKED